MTNNVILQFKVCPPITILIKLIKDKKKISHLLKVNFVLFILGRVLKGSENGSVLLIFGFETFSAVATFLEDYQSGALFEHFRPIQDAVRQIPGYENFTLTIEITNKAITNFLYQLGSCF